MFLRHRIGLFLGVLLILLAVVETPASAAPDASSCKFEPPQPATVVSVGRRSALGKLDKNNKSAGLGSAVAFELPAAWTSECLRTLVLYVNGQPVADAPRISERPLTFVVQRTKESANLWQALLGQPEIGEPRPIRLGVGTPAGTIVAERTDIQFDVLPSSSLVFFFVVFAIMLAVFGWCVLNTSILRDGVPNADASTMQALGAKATFSLAKTQGAVWFFVVLGSYLFIGIVTGDFASSISGSAVMLLGISGATVLGSAVVDASKKGEVPKEEKRAAEVSKQRQDKDADIKRNDTIANDRSATSEDRAAASQDLVSDKAQYAEAVSKERKLKTISENFVVDILSDANGISFHRFQMAVWTVVLGFVFILEVYEKLAMPSFNATLVGLLGISASTYVGLKIPEPTIPK